MKNLQTWAKADSCKSENDTISGVDWCKHFEKQLWFQLGKRVWSKYCYVFQDHLIYIDNDIVNPYRLIIFQYAEYVRDMHDLNKLLHPTLQKWEELDQADWKVISKEFTEDEICAETKDILPISMKDQVEDKDKDYCSFLH